MEMIPIFLITFFFYAISEWLVKVGKLNGATQKKIWNILLLITFLVAAITSIQFGLRGTGLKFQIFDRDAHTEYGFAMIAISICHIVWHWQYFKTVFKK